MINGYARALTFANGRLYAIGSAKGRIVEIMDFLVQNLRQFRPLGASGTRRILDSNSNDAEFFDGFWYASSYFRMPVKRTPMRINLSALRLWMILLPKRSVIPSGMTPYYLTVKGDKLYLAIFNHELPGNGDSILEFTPSDTVSPSCDDP